MGFDPFEKQFGNNSKQVDEVFQESRLDGRGLSETQWPAQIDRAATDLLYGVAIGGGAGAGDIGGVIDQVNFSEATGRFYVDGLRNLGGSGSDLDRALRRYDSEAVGKLAFHLNKFRKELSEHGDGQMDVDRAVEALVEKAATEAIEDSVRVDANDGAGLRQLRDSSSASDLVMKLFSDPSVEAYADALIGTVSDRSTTTSGLLSRLDEARMTTPLWKHQKQALSKWFESDQKGYVNMATATGKTVLGLATIAARYGALHPVDAPIAEDYETGGSDPRILVVAGNNLLLSQWREELDEHLDIPKDRTVPVEGAGGKDIELGWGTIEFRTAQSLLTTPSLRGYDLVILDEAHQYSRRKRGDERGWGDVFEELVDGSDAILAMSGSVDGGWKGDDAAENALNNHLDRCYRFTIPMARSHGVIADFSWEVHYAAATEEDETKLAEQTQIIRKNLDSLTGELDAENLGVDPDDLPTQVGSYADLQSFAQSSVGNNLREQSEEFDLLATALFTRRPVRWNLSPQDDAIVELIKRHAPAQKTVVLVQNYDDASRLRTRLVENEGFSGDSVIALESGDDDRAEKIGRFKDAAGGVLLGSGKLLGTGVNMPDAEVAVNVASGGVNASLVQRIGRVLRNPKGDKEARFYHVVPTAVHEHAIDPHEDGQQLLRRAAEFSALGETFKEAPGFSIATENVGVTVSALEVAGEETLSNRPDSHIGELVDTDAAADALRELRAAVQADESSDGEQIEPVVARHWPPKNSDDETGSSTSGSEDDGEESQNEGLFPTRDEKYEQYRLALDRYRAAKGVAEHLLGIDYEFHRENGSYVVYLPSEYSGSEFHEHLEEALDEYRRIKAIVNGEDGEKGSLPKYRAEWPAPPKSTAAMVDEGIAAAIGTDYSEDDPLFFAREDGELYELPLPDGRRLAVDRVYDPTETTGDGGAPNVVRVSTTLVEVARGRLDADTKSSIDQTIESWTRDLIVGSLSGELPAFAGDVEVGEQTTPVELSDDILSFVQASCENESSPFTEPDVLVETAIRSALDIEPGTTETVSTEVSADFAALARENDIDLEAALASALEQELQKW
ncbi:DEAD/DEAH box helicase [Haloferax sp. YSSS75]|uniref:DEAD/DEAH box helicase n=1 Tax=Haloferax sp. YSSS75 TaxID=3388564 RepID=UPI00398CE1F7